MKDLRLAGACALDRAVGLWNELIVEPVRRGDQKENADKIDAMIRTELGLGWSWASVFDEGFDFEWCGAFASVCWGFAGLDLDLRRLYFSSTSRLNAYAAYQAHFGTDNERELMSRFPRPVGAGAEPRVRVVLDEHSTRATLGSFEPRAGDIAIVGHRGSRYGTHVAIVDHLGVQNDRVGFFTVEGNARGVWADGVPRGNKQGVTRNFRPIGLVRGENAYHVRRIIRPGADDLTIDRPALEV